MQIVDAQIHTWGSGLPSNQSHIQVTHFTPEEAIALMDQGGVDAAVIHPPGWDPKSTEMAFAAVRNYPGRFAIMGALPLDRPESRARIATWRDQPGMLGLRYGFLSDPARRWLADGTLDWLWVEAEKAGVPIAMLATDSLAEIGRIADQVARHADLLEAVIVHEGRLVALHIEELHVLLVEADALDGLLGAKALVELGAAAQVAQLHLGERTSLPRLDQLALQHEPEFVLVFEDVARLKVDGVDFHGGSRRRGLD